jgi:hypothetical protein
MKNGNAWDFSHTDFRILAVQAGVGQVVISCEKKKKKIEVIRLQRIKRTKWTKGNLS